MKQRIFLLVIWIFIIFTCTACTSKEPTSSLMPESSSEIQSAPEVSPEPSAVSATPEPVSQSNPEAEEPESELPEREKKWRGDFSYFKRHYVMYHPDPFYYVSEEELDWQLEQLAKKVPELSDNDIFFELQKIVAGLGDNHTALHTPENIKSEWLPIGVKYFGDKLYLHAYVEGYDQFAPYLLHEIVSVNGIDIKYLQQKAASIAGPTNYWSSKIDFEESFQLPAFLNWAGCGYTDGYTIGLLDDDQKVVSVEVPTIVWTGSIGEVVRPENWDKIPLHKHETYVDYFETEEGGYVYLCLYGEMYPDDELYHGLMQKAGSLLAEHPGSKLVVDLRSDPGGYKEAVDAIKKDIPLLKESYLPQTYVVTGGDTTSAAIPVLLNFKREMDAIHVGEPTGQFTSLWGFHYPITKTMPSSQISFEIANHFSEYDPENTYYDEDGKLYPWENTVLPDVYISQDVEDVKAGKDSAIEWVMQQ